MASDLSKLQSLKVQTTGLRSVLLEVHLNLAVGEPLTDICLSSIIRLLSLREDRHRRDRHL